MSVLIPKNDYLNFIQKIFFWALHFLIINYFNTSNLPFTPMISYAKPKP